MAIRKQDFYEGAALCMLARAGAIDGLRFEGPFCVVNHSVAVLLKYSTGVRSPWGFTFLADEQRHLASGAGSARIVIALVCGADGVAAISHEDFLSLRGEGVAAVRIACRRLHGEWYEIRGPRGALKAKIPPSAWVNSILLEEHA
jgi:hypothetical protein